MSLNGQNTACTNMECDKLFDILSCRIVRKNACHDRAYDRPSPTLTCVIGNGGV